MSKLEELFGIDLRSLALFRIGLALLLIVDLINRATYLKAHYTDLGVLPRGALIEKFSNVWRFSVHLFSGNTGFQILIFLVAGLFALGLLVGYRTRLMTIASWFLLVSLHSRNPVVLQGGDILLRMLLFWAMFLPLGAAYSLDSALNSNPDPKPKQILSGGTVALLLQICFVYWFTVALKTGATWWEEGTAVYYALSLEYFTTPLGQFFLGFPKLLKGITYSTLILETFGPAFAFIPVFTGPIRTFLVFLFIGLHLGFGFCMELGLFPYISIAGWLPFLPTWFWENVFQRLRTPARLGLKIYYDGDCGFCKKGVYILRTFFLLPETPLLQAQDDPEIFALMEEKNSWVIIGAQGDRHFGFDGFITLARHSPLLWPLVPLLRRRPFSTLGENFYRKFASHRPQSAQFLRSLRWRELKYHSHGLTNGLALIFLVYIFLWDMRTVNPQALEPIFPKRLNWLGQILRLDQKWDMFAANPTRNDGWYVIPGTLKNGREVDLFKGGAPVAWEKPPQVSQTYPNQRWRKYLSNLRKKDYRKHRRYYASWLCREWNSTHPGEDKLDQFQIYFVQEKTLPDYQIPSPKKILLRTHYCFGKPKDAPPEAETQKSLE